MRSGARALISKAWVSPEQRLLYQFANRMLDGQKALLHMLRICARHNDRIIDFGTQGTPIAEKADGMYAKLVGGGYGLTDVHRCPTRTDRNEYVARLCQRLNLALEDAVKAAVVRKSGQKRRIGRQGDGRERRAVKVFVEQIRELCRHMLTVSRAATITAQHYLA